MSRLPGKRARPVLGLPDELYFSVVQCKLLTPDDFANVDDLTEKITAFEKRYKRAARPFDWRFGRADLNQLMQRIAA